MAKRKVIFLLFFLLGLTGLGMKVLSPKDKLDVRLAYTPQEAEVFFDTLKPVEAKNYLYAELLDLGFMAVYGLLSYLLFKRFFSGHYGLLLFIPALWDFSETLLIMMRLSNVKINLLLLSWSSSLKWLSGVCLGFFVIYRYFKSRQIDA